MQEHSITYPTRTICTRQRTKKLQAGDEVEVWDGMIGDYVWVVVMDAVQRNGRTKLRVVGANYYFDSNLCRDVRINHYLPPASARERVEIMRVDDEYFRVHTYWGNDAKAAHLIAE